MTQAEALADALESLFSNPEAGWFTPLSTSIQGISAEEAAQVPADRFNSVWAVVNHVRFWQEFILLSLQGQSRDPETLGSKNGWPFVPEPASLADWEADCERMLSINKRLAAYISTLDDETLYRPVSQGKPSPYQVVQGLIAHNAYHTCEVITIRHMLGLWLERT